MAVSRKAIREAEVAMEQWGPLLADKAMARINDMLDNAEVAIQAKGVELFAKFSDTVLPKLPKTLNLNKTQDALTPEAKAMIEQALGRSLPVRTGEIEDAQIVEDPETDEGAGAGKLAPKGPFGRPRVEAPAERPRDIGGLLPPLPPSAGRDTPPGDPFGNPPGDRAGRGRKARAGSSQAGGFPQGGGDAMACGVPGSCDSPSDIAFDRP